MHTLRLNVAAVMAVAIAGLAAASLAALLAPLGWPFELFAHFRWQLAAAAATLLLASLLLRRPWMMAIAFAALALQGLPVLLPARTATAHSMPPSCTADEVRVVTANAWYKSVEHAPLVDWLAGSHADVIALQEITPAWEASLAPLSVAYPHRKVLARADPYGIALLSRWPIVGEVREVDFADDGLPSLVATVVVRDRQVQVIAMHTRWPVLPEFQQRRDSSLHAAAALAATQAQSTILLGDLNLTPYAPAFARLVVDSGLRDALEDVAWRPTWRAGFWPLALPIDHVLVPHGACVTEHAIGPSVGSDHRPLQVTLRLP
jgi:endonuclease/exonuclease/phosphatase (EEP) superfamily protein YafD